MQTPRLTPRRGPAAFTLIELLTVVAIIGILAAIMLATLGKVRRTAQNAVCLSNMRQISTAMQLYANDHKRYLPGPLHLRQGPFYNIDYRRLPMRLRPYLSNPTAVSYSTAQETMAFADIFSCPAWFSDAKSDTIYSLVVNDRIERLGLPNLNPWGAGDDTGSGDPAQATTPPLRVDEFERKGVSDPGGTWLIAEADMQFPVIGGGLLRVVDKPVHGGHRNAIFCDMRVGRMDLANRPLR